MFPPKPGAPQVIVAVKADKSISSTALSWALTHATRPGDCITLLAIFSSNGGGRRFWGIPKLRGDCRSTAELNNNTTKLPDRFLQISESCSQMLLQVQDQIQVQVRIKVVSALSAGVVTAEAKSKSANWVILDKKLKREIKHCMDELHCNIVVMKGTCPKVLRLNLSLTDDLQTPFYSAASSPTRDDEKLLIHNMKHTTPVSSPEEPRTSYSRTTGECSFSSPEDSSFAVYDQNPLYEVLSKVGYPHHLQKTFEHSRDRESAVCRTQRLSWIFQNRKVEGYHVLKNTLAPVRNELGNLKQFNDDVPGDAIFSPTVREAISLTKTSSTPPPLCSLCQSKAPAFGNPPQKFHYGELDDATDGFSDANFVEEGGFGLVHRGVLRNGLIVAVKQLKFVGPHTDADFCREVYVLSCAQHRNVALLIGFCIEGKKRMLVYEYICNGSLDFHLHGNGRTVLDWEARLRIAIGTARGLRYLHEDCRVGCVVHRNLQPRNILLTHDYEPLVADFGLMRLHSEWEFGNTNQIIITPGYLAPEYFNDGIVTEKVDVYAFGLVLLELITGRKAEDMQYRMEHQFFLDNIQALAVVEPIHILAYKHQLLDPRLASYREDGLPHELHAMGCAASLCLQKDPESRPPMSKVVKLLESGGPFTPLALDIGSVGCRSGHMKGPNLNTVLESRRHSRRLSY